MPPGDGGHKPILDLVLTNEERLVDNTEYAVPLAGKSDHSIIKITTVRCDKQLGTPKSRQCYDKEDYVRMREMVSLNILIGKKFLVTACMTPVDS